MTAGARYATRIGIQDVIIFPFRLLAAPAQTALVASPRPCKCPPPRFFIQHPDATRSAPLPYISASNCFPAASTKIRPRMSIQTACPGRMGLMVCQQRSNSDTQLPANRPSRMSVAVPCVMSVVIRSTCASLPCCVWQRLFQAREIEPSQRKLLKDRRGSTDCGKVCFSGYTM